MDPDFDYVAEFDGLDFDELTQDVDAVFTDSQDWWPADFGHYGGLIVRMAWHGAGTYRITDGRGGAGAGLQRFAPLNSWPDNGNLDKARRLLWPVKKKYGKKISWADLMVFAGNRALETMGFKTFGFGGGRADVFESDDDTYWGPERVWLGRRALQRRARPRATRWRPSRWVSSTSTPRAPTASPTHWPPRIDIRETFGRMAMNDEETVALIAGGHTFGKTHGAADPPPVRRPRARGRTAGGGGPGWKGRYGTGKGDDAITSGIEVTWTYHPTRWDNEFFHILFSYEWELFQSPAGANQWRPKNGAGADLVPLAHDSSKRREPRMLTTDLALRVRPDLRRRSPNASTTTRRSSRMPLRARGSS